jgi:cell wall-associated NlpC family hydrolase
MARHRMGRDFHHHVSAPRGPNRRAVLLVIGGGAAGAWALGAYRTSAKAVGSESVEAAVIDYFQARANAANSRQTRALTARIDPANAALADHESERSGYLSSLGSASRWNGRINNFTTSPGILLATTSGTSATVRAYEELKIGWTPVPRPPIPTAMRTVAERDPRKYDLDRPAHEQILSAVGVAHEITLAKTASGWVVTSDAYAEDLFLGPSPDAARSPWAARIDTHRPNADLRAPDTLPAAGSETMMQLPTVATSLRTTAPATATAAASAAGRIYSWPKAVAYAAKYWSSYNSAYPNYNPCGGDCANFVSQCLRAGGETTDGTWYTHKGSGCTGSSTRSGSTAWVNNWALRNWTMNAHRGRSVSTIRQLGRGDIVNYDWTGNGTFDHVAIITNSASMLVTAHNTNHYNVPWSMGAKRHSLTWILGHF